MSLPRPVRAVVFDMDGLLVDSETVYCQALVATAAAMGHELPMSVFRLMVGHTWAGSSQVLKTHFGDGFDADRLREESTRRFYEIAQAEICLKAGVVELLDHLDAAGLPRAIATSSRHTDVRHHLSHHGLIERFHAILAQGDYPRGKPHPDPYLKAAEALGVDPLHCLALEDSHNGVRAASSAGMMTIMVPDLLDATEEMRTLCVRIARDLHEVHDLLRGS